MCRHVKKILGAQRDLMPPHAAQAVTAAVAEVRAAINARADRRQIKAHMAHLEAAANKWLKPYPHGALRDNIEVLLVAVAVALGIRTFFLQPFKIPTGSMQPTLYGITSQNLKGRPEVEIPDGLTRFADACVRGVFYHHLKAEVDGELLDIGPLQHVIKFINKQELVMRYRNGPNEYVKSHTLWFSPDDGLEQRAGLARHQTFRQGEDIIRMREIAGDHLFVDRLTYNFRPPRRGEIIVFETRGIDSLPQDQFYIKRLVATGGEHVRIGNDRHLVINGDRLDAATPHFENVYTFNTEPRDSQYSGHVNGQNGHGYLAPLFPNENQEYVVKPSHNMAMGDNTMNSLDSRTWGDFPSQNVIGKSFFVYWPISSRFGWGNR